MLRGGHNPARLGLTLREVTHLCGGGRSLGSGSRLLGILGSSPGGTLLLGTLVGNIHRRHTSSHGVGLLGDLRLRGFACGMGGEQVSECGTTWLTSLSQQETQLIGIACARTCAFSVALLFCSCGIRDRGKGVRIFKSASSRLGLLSEPSRKRFIWRALKTTRDCNADDQLRD